MSLRKLSLGTALSVALVGSLSAGQTKAADLDPVLEYPSSDISAMPLSNVVFGSGWYVRGDFGGVQLYQANPLAKGNLTTNSNSIFSSDAPGVTLKQSHELGYVGGIGGGYAFTSHLRGDVVIDYHMPVHSNAYGRPFACVNGYGPVQTVTTGTTTTSSSNPTYGSCAGAYQANVQSYDALVNGYFDLGTWYSVTPYIGAGVGLSFGHYQTSSTYTQADGSSYDISITNPASFQTYHIDYDRTASHTYYNFAYALMAGFAFPIFDHTKVDIGYRFLDLGTVLGTNLREHEVRAGLRYMIDN